MTLEWSQGEAPFLVVKRSAGVAKVEGRNGQGSLVSDNTAVLQPDVCPPGVAVAGGPGPDAVSPAGGQVNIKVDRQKVKKAKLSLVRA
jgi:hypothetical protein